MELRSQKLRELAPEIDHYVLAQVGNLKTFLNHKL